MLLRLIPALLAAGLLFPAAVSADTNPPVEPMAGEKLDPTTYGPAVIEDMRAVEDRDVLRRVFELTQPPAEPGPRLGAWQVPPAPAARHAASGERYVMNKWGAARMAIGFPSRVDLHGAFVAGHGDPAQAATCLRAIGYRDGQRVQVTGWFVGLTAEPEWLEFDLAGIDRVELEALPVNHNAAWYGLDDLSFTPVDAAGRPLSQMVILDFEDTYFKQELTGSDYAGLTWEEGSEGFRRLDDAVPGPRTPPAPPPDAPFDERGDAGGLVSGVIDPPTILLSFEGVRRGDAGQSSFPPDSCGAIGPTHYVEIVNRNLAIYNRETGFELSNVSLTSFLPGSSGDPRIVFDQHSNRWIVLVTDFSTRNFLAVSLTDNPTGQWFKTNWVVSQGTDANCSPDYPTLGVDANGIYTGAYMFGTGCGGMTVFAIDKAPLIAQNPSLGTITAFRGLPYESAIQPVHTYGDPGGEYLISTGTTNNALKLRRVLPPLTSPLLQDLGSIPVTSYSNPPTAPALGSNPNINTVDRRLMNAVYMNGFIYTAHCISFQSRAACRWYQIRVSNNSVVQFGTVTESNRHYYDPGICANPSGDVVMGFSGSNASEYVGAYVSGRTANDSPGQMSVPILMKAGEAAQNNIDGANRNRWGDYSLTTLDPLDNTTLWTIQEYAESPANIWGTWIGKLRMIPTALKITLPFGAPSVLTPGAQTSFPVLIENGSETVVPGSPTLWYRFSAGAFQPAPLIHNGGDSYTAVIPPATCAATPQFYVSAQGDGGTIVSVPDGAPASFYSAQVGDLVTVADDNFETNQGWTVTNTSVTAGAWVRAVPAGSAGARGDPVADYDGSGQCWVTGNGFDEDLDGGPTRATSPVYDLSAPGQYLVSYARWFYNDDNDADRLTVEISNNNGSTWVLVESIGGSTGWQIGSFNPASYVPLTTQMRLRFSATDNPNNSVTEAAFDALKITRLNCTDVPQCAADLTGDGRVCQDDLGILLGDFGCTGGACAGDVDGDGDTDQGDLGVLLAEFNTCGGGC